MSENRSLYALAIALAAFAAIALFWALILFIALTANSQSLANVPYIRSMTTSDSSIIDWKIVLSLTVPALVAIAGWFYAHWLTAKRERLNKRREIRLKGLEKAYLKISNIVHRNWTTDMQLDFENFISEIQLYGTPRQIDLMIALVEALLRHDPVLKFDAILEDLRDSLREELDMESVKKPIWWYRFNMPQVATSNTPNQQTGPTAQNQVP